MASIDLELEFMHAVTRYDRKQVNKKYYNHNALGLYMIRAAETAKAVRKGKDLRTAIIEDFTDRLCDHLLKWFGLPVRALDECH